MEYVLVAGCAFVVSGLTLFSGFGLGTLLMPVFALFFPVETAVAATAVVHGANNVLKASLFGRHADWQLVLRFGLPAVPAAALGATVLLVVSDLAPIVEYSVGGSQAVVTPIKLLMGLLMMAFALFELLPRFRRLEFDRKLLTLGGLLSGFFGGLSGHQGALRSAFLAKVGITTEAFVGTNSVIGLGVDLTRLAMYGAIFFVGGSRDLFEGEATPLILSGIAAAFCGVMLGKKLVAKVTMKTVQTLTGIMLLGIAFALGAGLI
ncbi:MAG: sulfite exporter TauE/SafE family protein [Deltaproteobacteria bacterium]|nr:sulfite exporter TauE/SafE family protein [Deltaproteobacteria bacterium]